MLLLVGNLSHLILARFLEVELSFYDMTKEITKDTTASVTKQLFTKPIGFLVILFLCMKAKVISHRYSSWRSLHRAAQLCSPWNKKCTSDTLGLGACHPGHLVPEGSRRCRCLPHTFGRVQMDGIYRSQPCRLSIKHSTWLLTLLKCLCWFVTCWNKNDS